MAVRNFWISTHSDDSSTTQATGPRSKDAGFTTRIEQCDNGAIVTAATIYGWALDNGTLELEVRDHNGAIVHTFTTKR